MRILDSTSPEFERELRRFQHRGGEVPERIIEDVQKIISRVREERDAALLDLTRQFDHFPLDSTNMEISEEEVDRAWKEADRSALASLRNAAERIRIFHEKQKEKSWSYVDEDGVELGQIVRPLKRVGIYVPGGKASYPSSVLMNAVTAKVAGVQEIIMVTPTPRGEVNPHVLAAARIAGVDRIFRVGGAQAVAALAYGTETIPRVDKIVGPGNIYVALAKKFVFGLVDIDMIAGPSEILVIADETAHPDFIAADLLSQAEHDELAWPILVTPHRPLIEATLRAIQAQLPTLVRREIAEKSLENFGSLILVKDLREGARVANIIGPEHLEVMIASPGEVVDLLENAGAIFLGAFSAEPLGDYMAGPNHVLPTGGTSRFFSPLHVGDFYKRSSLISITEAGFGKIADDTIGLAELEGLPGHARSVRIRKNFLEGREGTE